MDLLFSGWRGEREDKDDLGQWPVGDWYLVREGLSVGNGSFGGQVEVVERGSEEVVVTEDNKLRFSSSL